MKQTHALALQPAASDYWLAAREQFDSIITLLQSPPAQEMTHSELEILIEQEGRELLRRLLQAHLDERSPGQVTAAVVSAEGVAHTHQRPHMRQLTSIFGEISLRRIGYGGRGLASLHPLDAALNLPPETYSHTLRQRVAGAAASQSYDQVVALLSEQTGAPVPKRQCEQLVARSAQDFEAFYAGRSVQSAGEVRATSSILVVTSDGKGVPVRQSELREATRKAATAQQPRLKHRRSKGEKSASKRMSTVAAVYTIAPYRRTPEQIVGELDRVQQALPPRPRPEDKRVWASLEQPPERVLLDAFEEAHRRDPRRRKAWVALVDGNELQLELLKCGAQDYNPSLVIILDLIHVLEYLWKAAWALFAEGDRQAEAWVRERLLEILCGRSSLVGAGLRRSATLRGLKPKQREPIDKCADYLLKYRDYLRYDRYLAAGYPIATGVIEGACRHLVRDRMELTGARWGLPGAEGVLRLRALRASGDFEDYWQFHLQQEYRRHHAARYAEEKVPSPIPPYGRAAKGSHLRLVN
jgi:hypothetical protein